MPTKTLYLIRHSLPDYPGGVPMCLGQTVDLPLGAEGLELACRMAEGFSGKTVDRIFSSPLLRARQTADALAKVANCPIETCDVLKELHSGLWEGMFTGKIREEYPSFFVSGSHTAPPGGETDESGLFRARQFLKYVETFPEGTYAATSHSGLLRILLADVCGIPLQERRKISITFAQVIPIVYSNDAWQLQPGTDLEIRV